MTGDADRLSELRRVQPGHMVYPEDVRWLLGLVDRLGSLVVEIGGESQYGACESCGAEQTRDPNDTTSDNEPFDWNYVLNHKPDCLYAWSKSVYGGNDVTG